jgi:WD40 repeat protein
VALGHYDDDENDGPEVEQPAKIRFKKRQHNVQPTRIVACNFMDQQGTVIIDKHEDKIIWMAISPDGQKLAAIDRGGILRVCNAKVTEELYCPEKESDGGVRDCACFSPDSRMLAVHQKNDRIYVYDVEAGRRIRDFETKSIVQKDSTQNGKILKMQWSTDGGYLAGMAGDTAIHVWTMNKLESSSEVDKMVWKLDIP